MPKVEKPINSRVVAITGFTHKYLLDVYKIPAEKCSMCYQGADMKRFKTEPQRKAEAMKRYPTPEGAFPVFGCIGAYEKRKGQVYLVEAMVEVLKEYPNAHLIL